MLLRNHSLLLISIYINLTLALNLADPLHNINIAPTPTTPTSPSNRSLGLDATFSCIGGPDYGDEIPISSCTDAANEMLANLPYSHREKLSFGIRDGGGGRGVMVPLPYMSISCMWWNPHILDFLSILYERVPC